MLKPALLWTIGLVAGGLAASQLLDQRHQVKDQRVLIKLLRLQADWLRLRREADEFEEYADIENSELRREAGRLGVECDELALQVLDLEEQVEQLIDYIGSLDRYEVSEDAGTRETPPDLSAVKLGLVGGHGNTRRKVLDELSQLYGLRDWIEVPPLTETSCNERQLRAKLKCCDLIVILTNYMGHELTEMIMRLERSGWIRGKVKLLDCRGKSGVVREILEMVTN